MSLIEPLTTHNGVCFFYVFSPTGKPPETKLESGEKWTSIVNPANGSTVELNYNAK